MDSVDVKEIVRLRALNLSPKQIARKLGLRPAEVTAVIKAQAEEASLARAERGELPPVEACFINTDLSTWSPWETMILDGEQVEIHYCAMAVRDFKPKLS